MARSKQTIRSRLFGPHTKAMNASEYEIVSSLLQYNTLVLPTFNNFETGDFNVSLEESLSINNSAFVADDFRNGHIIPFDMVNLHLPSKGYSALRHVARPDLFFVKDDIIKPIDVKNSVLSYDNLRQLSADTMAHIYNNNPYFSESLSQIISDTNTSLDNIIFEDGLSLSIMNAKNENSLWTILDKNSIEHVVSSPDCFSEEANNLFKNFLNEDVSYKGKVSALEMQKALGDVQTNIHHFGAAPHSLIVVDGLDKNMIPSFRFSYLRDTNVPLSIFPVDVLLTETLRDEYVKAFFDNPKGVDKELEKLFLPARLLHKISSLEYSIKRNEYRINTIKNVLLLDTRTYKSKGTQAHNHAALNKIDHLKKENLDKKKEITVLNNTYHKSEKILEQQKSLYAQHTKLGWEKYFRPVFDESMKSFKDELAKRGEKFSSRKDKTMKLNEQFLEYDRAQPFLINRSPTLAKLYISLDKGHTYHSFSLSEKRLLNNSK